VFRLGVDVGGTFSDLAVYDTSDDTVAEFKSLTTPDTVGCVAKCLEKAAAHFGHSLEQFLAQVELFCFGSTHALNTLLTDTGSTVGIVTTKGHRDVYHIAEMDRGGFHDIREAVESTFVPLVRRERIAEVPERVDYAGKVVVPLDEQATTAAIRELVEEQGVEALVVSFLWSHRSPEHERRAAEIARELYPDLHVTVGAEISGTLGEFTRLATAVINAYVGKRVDEQANGVNDFLMEHGLKVPILVMQLVGGVAPLTEVVRRPVTLLKSGPAGGTVAAASIAKHMDETNVVCIDMGGTSLDVSRIVDGEIQLNRGFTVRSHPIAVPGVEVESIGAGGGSIAVVEKAGGLARLRVGPESAGSSPGPACYGRGGELPTVTDANLVLGILDANVELGGEISLDIDRATEAIREHVAEPLGQDPVEAAWGVYRVVTAGMADAVEDSLISNGVDPRNFALMAFGAAAPAHASAIASRLGIGTVIIPSFFPVFSAYGLMTTDIRHVYNLTDDSVHVPVEGASAELLEEKSTYVAERLRDAAKLPLALLEEENVAEADRDVALYLDLRYSGQELQLSVAIPYEAIQGDWSGAQLGEAIAEWKDKYVRVYGEGAVWHEGTIELINYRAVGVGKIPSPDLAARPDAEAGATSATGEKRRIYLGEWLEAEVHRATALATGVVIEGPAVIEGELTTVLVGPGETAAADQYGNLRLTPASTWKIADDGEEKNPVSSVLENGASPDAPVADPVTLQVVHNRLTTLMRLMTRTLEQLAGTAVGREAGDYSTAFMDADGRIVAFGSAVITHLGHEVQIIPWIYEHYGRENIKPGDVFISNDPYTGGSVHSNDVGCTAPVFAEGELIGWVFCDMHFADVGGMVPGSFSPSAGDCLAEAVRFPPTRIYAAGDYREDVVRAFLNNTRIPTQIARDLSAEVGSLHFGIDAISDLARQYGVERLRTVMGGLQDFSEQMFRARLRQIPDGVYEWADYIEDGYVDDRVYRAMVRFVVADDELFLDYRDSSEAAPALLNCTRSGLVGGAMGPLIQQLTTGIPFNAGAMRPLHIKSDQGSFIDALFPTPLGLATAYGAWAVADAAFGAASLALQASGDRFLADRAAAQAGGGTPVFIFSGDSNQHGEYSIFLNMDGPGAEGQGAIARHDGGRGNNVCLYGSIPSIEAHEAHEPFLYLSREIWADSGGPGTWRGGFGVKAAVVVWGEQSSPQTGTFCTCRNAVPTAGIHGGYPSSGVYYGPIAGTPVGKGLESGHLETCSEIQDHYGESFESLPSKALWHGKRFLHKGAEAEVFVMTNPGGGGFGDPMERDPLSVLDDVQEGIVTPGAALSAYGVVLEDGAVSFAATERQRAELRRERVEQCMSTTITEGV
jgi:N-methylhydantoinase A/oxoprolinase/acetone carboxylase beta subunit/N-methylhydantoinase B/oxoprolinase/acetone carboxylase alpha subunit